MKVQKAGVLVALFAFIAVALAYFCGAGIPRTHAQVASTTISVGVNATLTANAEQYLAIPSCSIAANCAARLQLCNLTSTGAPDSTRCITIAPGGQEPWGTSLWVGVSESTTVPATKTVSTVPYGFGTLRVSVPNNEIHVQ